jgi:hypothetical protein
LRSKKGIFFLIEAYFRVRSSATDEKINEKQGKKTILSQAVSHYNKSQTALIFLVTFCIKAKSDKNSIAA